jgi:hypothetical protein
MSGDLPDVTAGQFWIRLLAPPGCAASKDKD